MSLSIPKSALTVALAALLTSCSGGGAAAECTKADCQKFCPEGGVAAVTPSDEGSDLSDFEQTVVAPLLEDVRAGIRAWDDQSIGVCVGNKNCDEFLGTEAGELSEGKHMIQAVLRVPKIDPADGWTVEFATECTITSTNGNSTTTSNKSYSKSYTVRYAGENKGYRLAPLYTIDSPGRSGASECAWSITLNHPDSPEKIEGSWKTPAE